MPRFTQDVWAGAGIEPRSPTALASALAIGPSLQLLSYTLFHCSSSCSSWLLSSPLESKLPQGCSHDAYRYRGRTLMALLSAPLPQRSPPTVMKCGWARGFVVGFLSSTLLFSHIPAPFNSNAHLLRLVNFSITGWLQNALLSS